MTDHIVRISAALDRYLLVNHMPAIEEPANDFEKLVNDHAEHQAELAEVKSLLKTLETAERERRDQIADALRIYFGEGLKEGMNNYKLSNGRILKFGHKIQRTIAADQVAIARELYEACMDKPAMAFDELLRVKYELAAAPFKKVTGPDAALAVSRMLNTKFAASEVKVD